VEETKVSRQTYYHLEERALRGMLAALVPGSDQEGVDGRPNGTAELQERLAVAERSQRRLSRLLFLTRKVVKKGPITAAAGRPRRKRKDPSWTRSGKKSSKGSETPISQSSGPTESSSTIAEESGAGPS